LASAWNLQNTKLAESNLLSYKVDVKLDVFGSLMMNRILHHVHRRNIIAVCHRGALNVAVQLAEKLP
jgi:hypothetical protein